MARHEKIEGSVSEVDGGGVADAEVDLLGCFFGLAPRSIDHLRREIDPGDGMTEFSKSESNEACSTSHVEHPLWWFTCETRDQIEPRVPLLIADEAVADLVVNRARLSI